jgi:hypothetical protein
VYWYLYPVVVHTPDIVIDDTRIMTMRAEILKKFLQEKAMEATKQEKERKKGGKNLSPRNRKACHSTSTTCVLKYHFL